MNRPIARLVALSAAVAVFIHTGPCASAASGTPRAQTHQPQNGDFVFSLLPKSLQRSPDLEMTVNTELTPFGRLLRQVTPQQPAYYLAYAAGFKARGDVVAGERPPKPEQIQRALTKALASAGYLPASNAHRPNVVIFYVWGSHNRMDGEMAAHFPDVAMRQRLERAMLVGGHAEVDRIARTLQFGESLTDQTPDYEYVRDQANDDLYYVAASAYDFAAFMRKERKLVWRTTMTVNSKGVSMSETLSPLIAAAGPFFGRETATPQIIEHRISRWDVQVGEPSVIETDVPLATPPPAPGKPSGVPPTH